MGDGMKGRTMTEGWTDNLHLLLPCPLLGHLPFTGLPFFLLSGTLKAQGFELGDFFVRAGSW